MTHTHCVMPVLDRFSIVRAQLDELGYKHPLKLDCLPLVEQILTDLVQTTESLQRYKSLAQDALEKCQFAQLSSQPYIDQNARLVRENNELHRKVLAFNEESENSDRSYKKKITQHEIEISDLKLIHAQLQARIDDLHLQLAEKTKQLLADKKYDVKVTVPVSGPKKPSKFRKTRIDAFLPPPPEPYPKTRDDQEAPSTNKVKILESRASALSQELKTIQEELAAKTEACKTLEQQVKNRDREIQRLENLLNGGIPAKAIIKGNSAQKIVELEDKIKSLETELKETTTKQHEAMKNAIRLAKRNERLMREMQDMDKVACAINSEKSKLKEKILQTEEEMNMIEIRNQELRDEVRRLKDLHLNVKIQGSDQLQKKLDAVMSELQDMKKREQDLMLEIKRLSSTKLTSSSHTRISTRTSKPSSKHSVPSSRTERKCSVDDERQTKPKEFDEPLPVGIPNTSQQDTLRVQALQQEKDQLSSECRRLKAELQQVNASLNAEVIELRRQVTERDYELAACRQSCTNLSREVGTLRAQANPMSSARSQVYVPPETTQRVPTTSAETQTETINVVTAPATGPVREETHPSKDDRTTQLETELHEMILKQSTHISTINNLEEQLRTSESELIKRNTQYIQLKNLNEQTTVSLTALKAEMGNIQRDLATAQARLSELTALKAELSSLKDEKFKLRTTLEAHTLERDHLALQVDEKAETIASLRNELQAKEIWITNAERTMTELRKQLESTEDTASARHQDMQGMKREMEILHSELEKSNAVRDALQRELRRLQNDLSTALSDCRISHRDLALSQREVEDLKQKLQDYVAEVERVELLLTQKEGERNDLLEHFRSLSQEATELETHNHSLKSETSEVRRTLHETESQVRQVEEQLNMSKTLNLDYEKQISDLLQRITYLESELIQLRRHSEKYQRDLDAVRTLCMSLENQKEALQEELEESRRQCMELESSSSQLNDELEVVKAHLHHEVDTKVALESVLEHSRQDSMQHRFTNEELNQEMKALRKQMDELKQLQLQFRCARQDTPSEGERLQVPNEQQRARTSEESCSGMSIHIPESPRSSGSCSINQSLQSMSPQSSN